MTLTFNYTKEEDIKALQKMYIRINNLKIFGILAIAFMIMGIIGSLDYGYYHVIEIIGSITFFLLILYEIYIHPKSAAKKRLSLYDENTIKFTDEGIEVKTKNYNSNFKWDFKKLFQSDNFYVLFTDRINFLIIPKNVFKTEEEETVFKNIVSEKTSKKFTAF